MLRFQGQLLQTEVPTDLVCGGVTAEIDGDGYVVARVGDDAIAVGDANEFQLELSRAAHACDSVTSAHSLVADRVDAGNHRKLHGFSAAWGQGMGAVVLNVEPR